VIFLIRHAETASNAARVVQTVETPLSDRGRAQAERLARRLAAEGVARILSSDLARAAITANCVRAATGAPLEFDPLLQERNFGAIRGMPYAEVGVDIFAPSYAPPGGESWQTFHARVDRAWGRIRELAAEVSGNLAVVTHGLVCYSLALRHVGQPRAEAPPLRFGNTALTVVDAEPPWRVLLLNCTAHLDDASADDLRAPSGL
jgi:broad specificity phosphatase PhoE